MQPDLVHSASQALSVLSDQSLCMTYFTIISSLIVLLIALPRKLGDIQWLGLCVSDLDTSDFG